VSNFDHHCKWVNNCVGDQNYKYFFFFISVTELTILFIFVLQVVGLIKFGNYSTLTLEEQIQDETTKRVDFILLIICCFINGVLVLVIGELVGFHAFLIARGTTTLEYLKE
jgi:hypothetical protein